MRRSRPLGVALATVLAVVVSALVATGAVADERVDAWGRDPNTLSGTIDEVCGPGPRHDAAADRPGRTALVAWLDEAFPEVEGFGGFGCREVINSKSSCRGRTRPDRSDCWSTHAAGRAIDVMVGGAGNQPEPPVGKVLGDAIVNHLLGTVDGVDNYRARVMGVQQLLWNGKCWSVSQHADEGLTDVTQLPGDCVGDHDDHVHITLSEAGADGRTSFHTGGAPVRDLADAVLAPTGDPHLVLYDTTNGRVRLRAIDPEGVLDGDTVDGRLDEGFTAVATADVGGNGDDEVFAYRESDGHHVLREIRSDGELGGRLGDGDELPAGHTLVATPDVDGDGDDELLLYRGDDGHWVLHELDRDGGLGDQLQADDHDLDVYFSAAATPDLDGDGDDELVLYRRFDGHHVVLDFTDADTPDDHEGDDAPPVDELDPDGDGDVDVAVAATAFHLPVADDAEADDADSEDPSDGGPDASSADDAPAGSAEMPGLGVALTAGFTTMAASDVDLDGRDELVLYRQGDGCLAIRRLELPVAEDPGVVDADDPDADQGTPADEPVQACLNLPDDGPDDVGEVEQLDPESWLVESREAVAAGWSAVVTAVVD